MSLPIKIIVGLGNPGGEYEKTRHNTGFWLVDEIAKQCGSSFKPDSKFLGLVTRAHAGSHEFWLLKPTTYMNRSGHSVKALAQFYKIELEEILVAHDELDFPAGVTRLKEGGGHGGHNGLRDIIAQFGGKNQFPRLRIGIGKPTDKNKMVDYVLGRVGQSEYNSIMDAINDGLRVLPELVAGDFQRAANKLHALPSKPI